MPARLRQLVGPVMALLLFGLAVKLLYGEIQKVTWEEFRAGLVDVPVEYLLIAVFLVALNYGMLSCYDLLALRYVRAAIPLRRVLLVSFLGYSLGNNLGTLLAAAPIRYRFYLRWGLTHRQIVAAMTVLGATFWSGLGLLAGVTLSVAPIPLPPQVPLPFGTQVLGFIALGATGTYLAICGIFTFPIVLHKNVRLRLPSLGLATVQMSIAAVDLVISATALYLVLPATAEVPFLTVMAAFLLGIMVSLITQVPGGLGVLELILFALLQDSVGGAVIASVLLFRVIYYILPLIGGMITLVAHEIYSGALEAKKT